MKSNKSKKVKSSCPKSGKNLNSSLKKHPDVSVTSSRPTVDPQTPCPCCGKLVTFTNFTRHVKTMHPEYQGNYRLEKNGRHTNTATNTTSYIECYLCDGLFENQTLLVKHLKEHVILRCDKCDGHFGKEHLEQHIRSRHGGNKEFFEEPSADILQTPIYRDQAANLKNYKDKECQTEGFTCSHCFATFKWKNDLRRHKRTSCKPPEGTTSQGPPQSQRMEDTDTDLTTPGGSQTNTLSDLARS